MMHFSWKAERGFILVVMVVSCLTFLGAQSMPIIEVDSRVDSCSDALRYPLNPRTATMVPPRLVKVIGNNVVGTVTGIAFNSTGQMYALASEGVVYVYEQDGTFLFSWGGSGGVDGKFDSPRGIAINGSGYVFVADSLNNRIQVFYPNGTFLSKFSTALLPWGIAVNGSGYIYVACYNEYRVQVFYPNGTQLFYVEGGAYMYGPKGIAVNGTGYMYVCDSDAVYQLYPNGTKLSQFYPGDPCLGVAVNDSGYIYISCWSGFAVFYPNTTLLYNHFNLGYGYEQYAQCNSLALNESGYIYVCDTYNKRIQISYPNGDFLKPFNPPHSADGNFFVPSGMAYNASRHIFVAEFGNDRISVFSPNGTFLFKWGISGNGDGQLRGPQDVAVNATGDVYVLERINNRIQVFSPDGTFLFKWDVSSAQGAQLEINATGHVFVSETGNNRIRVFYPNGTFLSEWGSGGAGDGQFTSPGGITVNGSGYVYVADTGNNRIQVLYPNGTYFSQWGTSGEGDGQFKDPCDVALNETGYVYVRDTENQRIQVFSPGGTFLSKWSVYGTWSGGGFPPFNWLERITIMGGHILVTDTNNHQILVFDNVLPTAGSAGIGPTSPDTTQDLTLSFNSVEDLDGDPVMQRVYWYRNNVLQPQWNDSIVVPACWTNKTDQWNASFQLFDGWETTPLAWTDTVTISNSSPVVTNLVIAPLVPLRGEGFSLSYQFSDLDGDEEQGTAIRWYRNGLLNPTFNDQKTIPANVTVRGEWWYASVAPRVAGETGTEMASPSVCIGNTAPNASNIAVSPAAPTGVTELTLTYDYVDADGDPKGLPFVRWYCDGVPQRVYDDLVTVPAGAVRPGDHWQAALRPFDGISYGALGNSNLVIIPNVAPTVSHPADLTFKKGAGTSAVTWVVTDATIRAPTYLLYRNDILLYPGEVWASGMGITISLTDLEPGTYTFRLVVDDGAGSTAADEVVVVVEESTAQNLLSDANIVLISMSIVVGGAVTLAVISVLLARGQRKQAPRQVPNSITPPAVNPASKGAEKKNPP